MALQTIIGPTILKGQSLSGAIDCRAETIIRIFVPPEWSYAPLSFLLSPDNVMPYSTVCLSNGRERVLTVQPSSMILGDIRVGAWIKFRSGTNEKSIPQKNDCQFRVTTISLTP